jgi:hypothetical protein
MARRHAIVVPLAAAAMFAAATVASLVVAVPSLAGSATAPERTKLQVVALNAPTRVKLDHPFTVSGRVTNRGPKTVPTVAVRVSVGPLPDPGFKIKWASARSGALKPAASRNFSFPITISARYDKEHTDKVSGQTFSFYGAGNYVIEACPGLAVSSGEGCRETPTITAS